MEETIRIVPMVALRDIVVLPGMMIHFDITRKISIQAIEAAMKKDQQLFLALQRNAAVENPELTDLYSVGCLATIKQIIKLPGNLIRVLVTGEVRGELDYFVSSSPYFDAEITVAPHEDSSGYSEAEQKAMLGTMKDLTDVYFSVNGKIGKDVMQQLLSLKDLNRFMEQLPVLLPLTAEQRQKILSERVFFSRFELLMQILADEIEELRIKKDIQNKLKIRVEKNQKEYVLREQLKVIREELGETGEAEELTEKLKEISAPDEILHLIEKEIERLKRLSGAPSESSVARTYIETLLAMPWEKRSEDSDDLNIAKEILDRDHYGLEKVKERILEYLAVRKRTGKAGGTILCLVGPPGTGKTSIARSVAESLNKKYVRVCLGGIRDEAEIRGHRRTYIGAMPGRIAAGIRQAGVKNPLMLLDEIDKVGNDYKGDPSAALLEVLDPEQNIRFVDHYLDVPTDLSEVLFLATANTTDTIPKPLFDRMEVIELSSYTELEKFHIAKEHLLEKERKENGLTKKELKVSDKVLRLIISGYTKEAGVRKLSQVLQKLCRKAVWKLMFEENETKTQTVTEKNLTEYLGKRKYQKEKTEKKSEVGIVRGLAYTTVGGVTLQIEASVLPGKEGILLTGQLGDVMKESAQIALTYVRSICGKKLPKHFFEENHLHIHVPEGAVPKDGPSAGLAMATAIYSAVMNIPVACDLAMTGEITLRGKAYPIGGLKEKLLAAKMAAVKRVLVPEKNRPDVEELPAEITDGLSIIYVETMTDVLSEALHNE